MKLRLITRFVQGMIIVSCLTAPISKAITAQVITGTLGSPNATTTIEGHQLPAPPQKFGGVIKPAATDSKQWWAPRVVPPKGAPNVLLIMTDDQGYGVAGTFGGVIPTPGMDRVAKYGAALHAIQFHCSLLAYKGGAHYRPESSLCGFRSHRRVVYWFSRL